VAHELVVYEGVLHGFLHLSRMVAKATQALDAGAAAVKRALANPASPPVRNAYNAPMTEFLSLDALAARIPDGSLLAIPPDHVGVAMAATRALLRRGVRHLRLLTVPTSGLQADL
jgi:hypothetical protein